MLRGLLACIALGLIACTKPVPPPTALGPLPSEAQLSWHELEYYMFVHFNMNTFSNMEWGTGAEKPEDFNPSQLDPRQWARIAKAAGMKGIILTAKHHDGFCLWPSAYTEHSVKNSPWKNGQGDVVQELADACRENGLKMGLYLSPWDRNHAEYGREAYITYFRNQLRELLTNYGEVFEVWFDGANGGTGYYGGANEERKVDRATYYDWPTTYQLVYELQPDAIIFSDAGPGCRWVGNEEGWANETNWSLLRSKDVYPGMPDYEQLRSGHEDGTDWIPAECDVSIRPGWYYHPYEDHKVKSLSRLVDIYYHSVGRNGNLLLNIPVDRRGLIHPADSARLMQLGEVIRTDLAEDLALNKRVSATYIRGKSGLQTEAPADPKLTYGPEKAVDGDTKSYWTTDDSVHRASLILDFGEPTDCNRILLQEFIALGQRVQAFSLEAEINGRWVKIEDQTTIGYKRIIRFPTINTSKIRLNIKAAKGPALISTLSVYHAPALLVAPEISRDKKGLVNIHVPDNNLEVYYTLNGHEPDPGEAELFRYQGEFMQREPASIKAVAVDPESGRRSSVVTHHFDISKGDWRIVRTSSGSDSKAGRLIDGDPESWWGSEQNEDLPQEIVIDLSRIYNLRGITYLPMQERYPAGYITRYEIFVSKNRIIWGKAVPIGEFSNIENNPIEQIVRFSSKEGRYLKIKATASIDGTAGFAEIGVITQ